MSIALDTFLPGGAVLDKELRCASRRRRYYVLRVAYLGVLTLSWGFAWLSMIRINMSGSIQAQGMMSEVPRFVTTAVAWIQFLLSQALMVLLLSGAISEEVGRGTLGVLLTTPLTSLQITLGKFLSRLVHLVLLLGLSLPVLATIRVQGGVPWDFILATWCVTLAAAWATAALALFISTWSLRATQAAGRTFLLLILLEILLQLVAPALTALRRAGVNVGSWMQVSTYLNPVRVMAQLTQDLARPGGAKVGFSWPVHCLVMLGLGSVLLFGTLLRIRRVGRRSLEGNVTRGKKVSRSLPTDMDIRAVWNPILVWRVWRQACNRLARWSVRAELIVGVLVLTIAYYVAGVYYQTWKDPMFHGTFVVIYTFIGLLRVAVHASHTVAEEREKRTWPLLMTTDLTPRDIVRQKIVGCLLPSLPAWVLLTLHLLAFIVLGVIHPITPFLILPFVASCVWMVACFGLCISLWCRRTTTAAVITVSAYLLLSVPICCVLGGTITSPLFTVGYLMAVVSGPDQAAASWFSFFTPRDMYPLRLFSTQWLLLAKIVIQLIIALVFWLIAPHWVRHRIFNEGGK